MDGTDSKCWFWLDFRISLIKRLRERKRERESTHAYSWLAEREDALRIQTPPDEDDDGTADEDIPPNLKPAGSTMRIIICALLISSSFLFNYSPDLLIAICHQRKWDVVKRHLSPGVLRFKKGGPQGKEVRSSKFKKVRSSKLCQITTLKSANPYPDIWCPQRFHKVIVTIHFYHKSRLAILKMSNQLWVNCLFKSLQLIQITPLRILFASICILIYDGLFSSAYLIIYMSTLHQTKCAFILSWCWIINKTRAEHHDNSEMSPKGIWFMN